MQGILVPPKRITMHLKDDDKRKIKLDLQGLNWGTKKNQDCKEETGWDLKRGFSYSKIAPSTNIMQTQHFCLVHACGVLL